MNQGLLVNILFRGMKDIRHKLRTKKETGESACYFRFLVVQIKKLMLRGLEISEVV